MPETLLPATDTGLPYLEYGPVTGGQPTQRIVLDSFPFVIGRGIAAHFVLSDEQVSKKHASIERDAQGFRVRDLGSTNGTFVNGQAITESPLCHDDILHVARAEFRFVHVPQKSGEDSVMVRTIPVSGDAPASLIRSGQYLQEMLAQQSARVIYQPIVCLTTRQPMGYEALARGMHNDLSIKPAELLRLADQCGVASSLSRMFRQAAVADAANLPEGLSLFLNFHPAELTDDSLLNSLGELREFLHPTRPIVVEIPETAVTDLRTIRALRDRIQELGFQVAYDDFGAGQARFLELTEVPPDFIKLDMQLVRNLHLSESRQNLIAALNRVGRELNVSIIAEGVETREEAQVCRELGCHLGQGYWFGRPTAVGLVHQSSCPTQDIDLGPILAQLGSQAKPAGR